MTLWITAVIKTTFFLPSPLVWKLKKLLAYHGFKGWLAKHRLIVAQYSLVMCKAYTNLTIMLFWQCPTNTIRSAPQRASANEGEDVHRYRQAAGKKICLVTNRHTQGSKSSLLIPSPLHQTLNQGNQLWDDSNSPVYAGTCGVWKIPPKSSGGVHNPVNGW